MKLANYFSQFAFFVIMNRCHGHEDLLLNNTNKTENIKYNQSTSNKGNLTSNVTVSKVGEEIHVSILVSGVLSKKNKVLLMETPTPKFDPNLNLMNYPTLSSKFDKLAINNNETLHNYTIDDVLIESDESMFPQDDIFIYKFNQENVMAKYVKTLRRNIEERKEVLNESSEWNQMWFYISVEALIVTLFTLTMFIIRILTLKLNSRRNHTKHVFIDGEEMECTGTDTYIPVGISNEILQVSRVFDSGDTYQSIESSNTSLIVSAPTATQLDAEAATAVANQAINDAVHMLEEKEKIEEEYHHLEDIHIHSIEQYRMMIEDLVSHALRQKWIDQDYFSIGEELKHIQHELPKTLATIHQELAIAEDEYSNLFPMQLDLIELRKLRSPGGVGLDSVSSPSISTYDYIDSSVKFSPFSHIGNDISSADLPAVSDHVSAPPSPQRSVTGGMRVLSSKAATTFDHSSLTIEDELDAYVNKISKSRRPSFISVAENPLSFLYEKESEKNISSTTTTKESSESIESYEKIKKEYEEQLENVHKENRELLEKYTALQSSLSSTQNTYDSLIEEAQEKLKALESRHSTTEEEKSTLQSAIDNAQDEISAANKTIDELISQLNTESVNTLQALHDAETRQEELNHHYRSLIDDLNQQLETTIYESQKKILSLPTRADMEKLQQQLDTQVSMNTKMSEEMKLQRIEYQDIQNQYSQLLSSHEIICEEFTKTKNKLLEAEVSLEEIQYQKQQKALQTPRSTASTSSISRRTPSKDTLHPPAAAAVKDMSNGDSRLVYDSSSSIKNPATTTTTTTTTSAEATVTLEDERAEITDDYIPYQEYSAPYMVEADDEDDDDDITVQSAKVLEKLAYELDLIQQFNKQNQITSSSSKSASYPSIMYYPSSQHPPEVIIEETEEEIQQQEIPIMTSNVNKVMNDIMGETITTTPPTYISSITAKDVTIDSVKDISPIGVNEIVMSNGNHKPESTPSVNTSSAPIKVPTADAPKVTSTTNDLNQKELNINTITTDNNNNSNSNKIIYGKIPQSSILNTRIPNLNKASIIAADDVSVMTMSSARPLQLIPPELTMTPPVSNKVKVSSPRVSMSTTPSQSTPHVTKTRLSTSSSSIQGGANTSQASVISSSSSTRRTTLMFKGMMDDDSDLWVPKGSKLARPTTTTKTSSTSTTSKTKSIDMRKSFNTTTSSTLNMAYKSTNINTNNKIVTDTTSPPVKTVQTPRSPRTTTYLSSTVSSTLKSPPSRSAKSNNSNDTPTTTPPITK